MSITTRAALVLACALPALGAGCVESEGTLLLECVAASTVEVDEETGESTITAAGGCEEGGAGFIFPASAAGQTPIFLTAFFVNQMSEDQRPSTLRVRSRDVILTEYEIGITGLDGTTELRRVPGSGFVPSGQGPGQVGESATQFFVGTDLTAGLTQSQTAVLEVRFFGRTTGGDDVETPWFYYPIIVSD
jgi:hypothetical protein